MSLQEQELPYVHHWPFDPFPDLENGVNVEFRLTYEGRLPAASRSDTRNHDKDVIRRALSLQLQELYRTHPALINFTQPDIELRRLEEPKRARVIPFLAPGATHVSGVDAISSKFEICKQRYFPLVYSGYSLACSLDILFLRRDQPGNVIRSGGDLDNRLKVLFDALRMPSNCDEAFPGTDKTPTSEPMFVLLENDNMIVDVKVTSDRLLTPRLDGENINDVRLVILVKTIVLNPRTMNSLLWG